MGQVLYLWRTWKDLLLKKVASGIANSITEGRVYSYIFVFSDYQLKRMIAKEISCAEHEYINMCPQLSNLLHHC